MVVVSGWMGSRNWVVSSSGHKQPQCIGEAQTVIGSSLQLVLHILVVLVSLNASCGLTGLPKSCLQKQIWPSAAIYLVCLWRVPKDSFSVATAASMP